MTDILDQFALLDFDREMRLIDENLSSNIRDQWSLNDPELFRQRFNVLKPGTLDSLSLGDDDRTWRAINSSLSLGGGGGYVAKAVTFPTGAYLASLNNGLADNAKFTAGIWVNVTAALASESQKTWDFIFTQRNGGGFGNDILDLSPIVVGEIVIGTNDRTGSSELFFGSGNSAPAITSGWHFIFGGSDTGHAVGDRTQFLLVDGVDVIDPSDPDDTADIGPAFSTFWENIIIPAVNAVTFGAGITFDIADLQIWVGQVIDPNPTNLAKFISDGKPVDPADAGDTFGQQTILLSGDALSTGFQKNRGTLGDVFALTNGPLTNATTSPSD